jgi:hypothetical protein
MNLSSSLMTAAITGIMAGAVACGGSTPPAADPAMAAPAASSTDAAAMPTPAASDSAAPAMPMDTAGADGAKHDCKGKNDCKGKGNCKTDKHACKGKNDCKGQGGCKG